MAHFILTSRYNSSYRQTSVTKNLFDGVGIERRDARRSRFEIFSRRHALHCNVYDIANIDSIVKIAGLRDDYGIRRVFQAVRFDQINVSPLARVAWSHDVCGLQYNCQGNRFASCPAVTLPYNTVLYGVYDALPPSGRAQGTALFDAETERPITGPLFTASGIFDVPFENIYRATNRFNSVVDFCRLDLNKGLFDGVRDLAATAQRKNCFDICVYVHWHDIVPIRYDIPHPPSYARFIGLYDIIAKHGNCSAARRQAFVRPGWSIIARNIESGTKIPVGWIGADSETWAIENVFLPDGDYEILVRTSSLFWKDATEHVVRTISIREGQELSPLPVIYNLRSEVSNDETTVHWSATRCETDECVFGVWLSQTSPVDTTLPANETIFYSRELTQYQLGIIQSEPKYVAVVAIRTGNTEEIGPVYELFLPWSSEKPRAPDDAVVLPKSMTPVSPEEIANNP